MKCEDEGFDLGVTNEGTHPSRQCARVVATTSMKREVSSTPINLGEKVATERQDREDQILRRATTSLKVKTPIARKSEEAKSIKKGTPYGFTTLARSTTPPVEPIADDPVSRARQGLNSAGKHIDYPCTTVKRTRNVIRPENVGEQDEYGPARISDN